MRAYVCPECDHVHAIGSDGLVAEGVAHTASDGSTHYGATLIELPEHDHITAIDWHRKRGNQRTTGAHLRAAFPPVTASGGAA